MIRKIHLVAAVTAAVLCAACDTHIDVPDTARSVQDISSARTERPCLMHNMNNRGKKR